MNSFARHVLIALALVAGNLGSPAASLLINEVMFNPPGTDSPVEFLELRGTPNVLLPAGTFFVAVEGDAGGNPGTIQNVFDLSGLRVGGNGLFVLLQKTSPYLPGPGATVLMNTNGGSGWGSGSSSSVGHRGYSGITELKNASITYFLLQAANLPMPGADIDPNDDGVPDGSVSGGWTVLDSAGVLDADGAGDFAYGAVSFRHRTSPGSSAGASGVVIPVDFTPRYIGRPANGITSTAVDWVAGDSLGGTAPDWVLGSAADTYPASMANLPLNHLGAANFGAPALPGVLLNETSGGTAVPEGGGSDSYNLALNTRPAGAVTVRVSCPIGVEASVDNGSTFGPVRDLLLDSTGGRSVTVRALADDVIDVSPRLRWVTNTIIATGDPANYPLTALIPAVGVAVTEKDTVIFSELKVNPPGTNDAPNEFIELKGPAGALFSNVCVIAIEGNAGADPGWVAWKVNLTGSRLGNNGLLLIAATNHPYTVPTATTVVPDPLMSQAGGALGNGSISFLAVSSAASIDTGIDLDRGNNGVLEGLPADASILDAVGWDDGGNGDVVYGNVVLELSHGTPDAATRLSWDDTPNAIGAWTWGDLEGENGETLAYDAEIISAGFPSGTLLSPGGINDIAPIATGLAPISGVIGDPYNPVVEFVVSDEQAPPSAIIVSAISSNAGVVPDTNLVVVAGPGGARTLSIAPVGVGYADITLLLSHGSQTGRAAITYAASAPERPGGTWHIGASDASTAIPIDDRYMIVGDDENQVLRLYDRQRSGLPLRQFDMTSHLDLPDVPSGLPREVDVEASTRVGNRLFWIGSLGHAATGETRTNRTRVFATDLSGTAASSELVYAGRYDFLKVDLIAWDVQNLHGKGTNYYGLEASDADGVPPKAPDGSGFAIEGLAMMPGNTNGAFVGFRAPIVPATNRTFALVVPVLNFATLAASGGPSGSAVFGSPIELDLFNRGIRSIEGTTNGYFILAGPPGAGTGPYPQDFRLYTWTGNGADQPRQRGAILLQLNPEGIVGVPPSAWDSDTELQLISDEGATVYYGDGIPAKFLPVPNFKKARSDWVTIGSIEKVAPMIVSASIAGNAASIRWRSVKGETYQLQYTMDLGTRVWVEVPGGVTASGPYASKTVPLAHPNTYFRVMVSP